MAGPTISAENVTIYNLNDIFKALSFRTAIHEDCLVLLDHNIIIVIEQGQYVTLMLNPEDLCIPLAFKIPMEAMFKEVLEWVNELNNSLVFARAVCIREEEQNRIVIKLSFEVSCSDGLILTNFARQANNFIHTKNDVIKFVAQKIRQLPRKVLLGEIETGYRNE